MTTVILAEQGLPLGQALSRVVLRLQLVVPSTAGRHVAARPTVEGAAGRNTCQCILWWLLCSYFFVDSTAYPFGFLLLL